MAIHWCGTGLSAIPGLRRLIKEGHDVVVWNRTIGKAQEAIGDLTQNLRTFEKEELGSDLTAGDVVVSMLPGDWHVPLAELAISKGANFVSSSYIAPEMRELHAKAKQSGVIVVNEVGLDPGIDHLMAHKLVEEYRTSDANKLDHAISFNSYCGGIPKIANPFLYKFSWSPLGVLKALRSPSRSIRGFEELNVNRPWDAISNYVAPLPKEETFEVYPNRDSLPFMAQYRFADSWKVKEFVRGTLRLNGWKDAWNGVFEEIETLSGPQGEDRLMELSSQLWKDNSYNKGEPDRVVMCVDLKAEKNNQIVWHKTYVMDAWGDEKGTAMARLVSYPVSFAVEAVLSQKLSPGVSAAPDNLDLISDWLNRISGLAQHLEIVDHVI